MGWKYQRIRSVVAKYRPDMPSYPVVNSTKKDYGKMTFTEGISFWDALDDLTVITKESEEPMTMEELDIPTGFVLYRGKTPMPLLGGRLHLEEVHDRAYVYNNMELKNVMRGHGHETDTQMFAGPLDILIENQGRYNVGGGVMEQKGIAGPVMIGSHHYTGWTNVGLGFSKVRSLKYQSVLPKAPAAFYKGSFHADEVADTFFNPTGWTKGMVWVNGHLLGRYHLIGPQLTLYCPRAFVQQGENEVIIFELEKIANEFSVTFDDAPSLVIIP
jgi:beta-galactosidase